MIVRVTLENAVLTYTNARSADITSSDARYKQNHLHYSRKFEEILRIIGVLGGPRPLILRLDLVSQRELPGLL